MPLLPLYAFTEWTGTTFTFTVIGYLTTFYQVNSSTALKRHESLNGKDMERCEIPRTIWRISSLKSACKYFLSFQLRSFHISVLRTWKCSEIITEGCSQHPSITFHYNTSRTLGVRLNARHFTTSPFTQRSVTDVGADRLINLQ